jgi:predicted MPP superfamily phosphohydrolase
MADEHPSSSRGESQRCITWLHLSDLHTCKPKTGWDAHRVLDPLLEDLHRVERDHGLVPDLVFFTGDLVFGQVGTGKGERIQEQLDDGHAFLEAVRGAFSTPVPLDCVFIVPGNHDVVRGEVTEDQWQWLDQQENVDAVTKLIQKTEKQWLRYMERLAAFKAFLQRHGYTHLLDDPNRLIYAEKRTIAGLKIGIAGLNSAWSCCRDKEKGKLWFGGSWQTGHVTSQLKDTDFRLALTHHPPNWFGEYEERPVRRLVEREFEFYLHGHEHDEWVTESVDGHVRIAAAACYDRSDEENGYNFVRLDLNTGQGEVWLRHFDSSGGGWVPRLIANRTNNEGVWPLRHLKFLSAQRSPKGEHSAQEDLGQEGNDAFQRMKDQALQHYHQHVRQEWDARWSRVVGGGDDE